VNGTAPFRAWATVDLKALQHNFAVAQAHNPGGAMVAVVKANAYGHGMLALAAALHPVMGERDCFGVATLDEAIALQQLNTGRAILLLEGVLTAGELAFAVESGFHLLIHSAYQLEELETYVARHPDLPTGSLTVWLKLDTGMHRLGFSAEHFASAYAWIKRLPAVGKLVLTTHFACGDDLVSPATQRQLTLFNKTISKLDIPTDDSCEFCVAASAGVLAWPQTHFQWARPGIMLYGGSAIQKESGVERDLKPVMTLRSRLIAIKDVEAGGAIGYGATYICPGKKRMGVVSIGYGDGYPRAAPNGTPVLVNCAASIVGKPRMTRIIGRVSMDMITIDLSDIKEASIGDEVILWGEGLPADEVARHCDTISYELFCRVTARVHFVYK
jgi:alanine racemase